MNQTAQRVAELSAPKRELLLRRLQPMQAPQIRSILRGHSGESGILSFSQEQIWLAEQIDPGSSRYTIHHASRLKGELDRHALERALNAVVERHDALRSRFAATDGKPHAAVSPAIYQPLPFDDLSGMDESVRETECRARLSAYAFRPFDLATGPLFRWLLTGLAINEHVLLLAVHHAVFDGASIEVFFSEVQAFYGYFRSGTPHNFQEAPPHYTDFAGWQRREITEERLDAQLGYWTRQLADLNASTGSLTDYPRSRLRSKGGAVLRLGVAEETARAIDELCRRYSTTTFCVLLAAYKILLWRYTGTSDLAVGTPVTGRTQKEFQGIIGPFVNTVVLRSSVESELRFTEFVGRVRETVLGAWANQDVPFQKLVARLNPERNALGHPFFNIMFAARRMELAAWPGLEASIEPVRRETSLFDLEVTAVQTRGSLTLVAEYSCDLFEKETVGRMLGHYAKLLGAVVRSPEARISDLHFVEENELECVTGLWNRTAAVFPEKSVEQLFIEQAERTPAAIALECRTTRVTYADLLQRAGSLARTLEEAGCGGESIVPVCIERSPEMIVAILAVLMAGASWTPIDPGYPPRRIALLLESARANTVLTSSAVAAKLSFGGRQVLCVDADFGTRPRTNTEYRPAPGASLAYTIFTSGSTGSPKGVMVERRSLANYTSAAAQAYRIEFRDRVLQFASFAFDACLEEIFPTLIQGATLVLRADAAAETPSAFLAECEQRRISVLNLPTAYWRELAAAMDSEGLVLPDCVRVVIIGGEQALTADLVRWQRGCSPATRLFNTYGPTEGTIVATMCEVATESAFRSADGVSIGRPVPNVRTYILAPDMNPVPIGVAGELWIAGAGLARGYLNEPALTAEYFRPDPFASSPGSRLYRSRDLARWRDDGSVEFVGRVDHQVKVLGHRIELREVERAIQAQASVKEVAIAVRHRKGGQPYLAAFVELTDASCADTLKQARAGVQEVLPAFMRPAAWIVMNRLPRTPGGKVDRKSLPEEAALYEPPSPEQAPRPESVEARLASIWAEVLNIPGVGLDSNIFELGGDSILVIQIAARARRAGLYFRPKQLLELQTIRALAPVVEIAAETVRQRVLPAESHLTPIQHWFFEQETNHRNHYNQRLLLRPPDGCPAGWLKEFCQLLCQQHDSLRLRFRQTAEAWRQYYASAPDATATVEWIDLTSFEGDAQVEALQREGAEIQRSLDITDGPLFRAAVFDLGAKGLRLLLVVHHLAIDGVSWRIVMDDLARWYDERSRGKEPGVAPATTSFGEWANRLHEQSQTLAAAETDYWTRQETQETEILFTDFPVQIETTQHERQTSRSLGEEATSCLLGEANRAYNTGIMDLLMTSLSSALHEWRGHRRVRIGVEGHGREDISPHLDVSRTVGWFTSLYPVILEWREGENMEQRLVRVKEQLRGVPRGGIGYGALRYRDSGLESIPSRRERWKEPDIVVNYLGQFDRAGAAQSGFGLVREHTGPVSGEMRRSTKLELNAIVTGGRLKMFWTWGTLLHRAESVEQLADLFGSHLVELGDCCARREPGGRTASDFAGAGLDQRSLNDLLKRLNGSIS